MKRIAVGTMLTIVALIAVGSTLSVQAADKPATSAAAKPIAVGELQDGMRKLWEDHIIYTRNFIISAIAGLGDTPAVTERLLRNQDDIGNAIKPIYGDDAGKKLTALLRDHILIAADIVKAAKASDTKAVEAGQKKWRGNADDIAAFLSGANPQWKKADLTSMLYTHLDLTTTEVVSRIKKDWAADIAAFDKGHDHMLMFSDMLTDGIVKQFPKKFSRNGTKT